MTEYYKYHHWNIIFNRRKENDFDNDHYNTSNASSRLMKYSQSQFEKKLRVEHESLLGEYHDDVVKNQIPQSSPKTQSTALHKKILKPPDEMSLHAAGQDEIIGSHFIPGLQHAPGISSSHPENLSDLKQTQITDPSSTLDKNLSLFALIEENAIAQQEFQKKFQYSDKHDSPDLHRLLAPRFTAFENFSDKNKSELFSYVSPAQLSLKYYLKQCRPQSAPGPMEQKVKSAARKHRSKSAEVDSNVAEPVPVERPATPGISRPCGSAYSRPKRVSLISKPGSLPIQEVQSRIEPVADNIAHPSNIKIVVNDSSRPYSAKYAKETALTLTTIDEDISSMSKKVDFGAEVKHGAAIQSGGGAEKLTTSTDDVVVVTPRGILRRSNSEESLDKLGTLIPPAIAKAIGFSKVKYEDGSTAVFGEKGELTLVENEPVAADGEADALSKGKKGKGKKAEKKSEGKGKKGKGKKKKKGDTSDSEVEETVRRRKKDMKFCSKLLYSIAATSEDSDPPTVPESELEPVKEDGKDPYIAWDSDSKNNETNDKSSALHTENNLLSTLDNASKSDPNLVKTSHVTFSFDDKQSNVSSPRKQSFGTGILKKQ